MSERILLRVEATQRLQGRGRVCGGVVAVDSSRFDSISTFDTRRWVMKVLVVLIALGFPAALIFSGRSRSHRKTQTRVGSRA